MKLHDLIAVETLRNRGGPMSQAQRAAMFAKKLQPSVPANNITRKPAEPPPALPAYANPGPPLTGGPWRPAGAPAIPVAPGARQRPPTLPMQPPAPARPNWQRDDLLRKPLDPIAGLSTADVAAVQARRAAAGRTPQIAPKPKLPISTRPPEPTGPRPQPPTPPPTIGPPIAPPTNGPAPWQPPINEKPPRQAKAIANYMRGR